MMDPKSDLNNPSSGQGLETSSFSTVPQRTEAPVTTSPTIDPSEIKDFAPSGFAVSSPVAPDSYGPAAVLVQTQTESALGTTNVASVIEPAGTPITQVPETPTAASPFGGTGSNEEIAPVLDSTPQTLEQATTFAAPQQAEISAVPVAEPISPLAQGMSSFGPTPVPEARPVEETSAFQAVQQPVTAEQPAEPTPTPSFMNAQQPSTPVSEPAAPFPFHPAEETASPTESPLNVPFGMALNPNLTVATPPVVAEVPQTQNPYVNIAQPSEAPVAPSTGPAVTTQAAVQTPESQTPGDDTQGNPPVPPTSNF